MDKTLHASCVAIDGHGVLIQGPSGSGKSDLALQLMDQGAVLVADDYVELHQEGEAITVSPPQSIEGLIEIRGIGLIQTVFVAAAPLILAVELRNREDIVRMPDTQGEFDIFAECPRPLVRLGIHDGSNAAKVRFVLNGLLEGNLRTKL